MATATTAIKAHFEQHGYLTEKDPKNTRRFYLIKDNEVIHLERKVPVEAFLNELLQTDIETFIKKYQVGAQVQNSDAPSVAPKKTKVTAPEATDDSFVPSSLKRRRQENGATVESSAPISLVNQMTIAPTTTVDYGIRIPREHNGYHFPSFVSAVVRRTEIGRNVFLTGPAGTGKTQMVLTLAQLMGQRVIRVNFQVGTTSQHLIGKFIIKNGQTEFIHGVLPLAMQNGWWILFDEMDYAMPEHMSILQPVLEGEPLLITENENEEIVPHENFRIFATGNTKGRGDETQAYVGTGNLNLAFLDRWAIFELTYTNKEPKIVQSIIGDAKLSQQISQYFSLIRKACSDGVLINAVFSTRRLIQFAEALKCGETLSDALNWELWSRYDKHEIDILKEFAYDIWQKDHYLKNWKLGDEHYVDQNAQQVEGTVNTDTEEQDPIDAKYQGQS